MTTLFFLMLLTVSVYAEKLHTVKTKYFDIIYAEASAPSAALLAEYADGYADEICAALHKEMKSRMPVYLVSDTEDLNGYFTPLPYRRIVLFDTATEDGQLSNLTDTVLQVFYHELTHAVSLESPFSLLSLLPMSFVEGVAVSFESLYGQGRLHDPLMKQYLIQNKIDGTTPTWREASGARDMYPGGIWPYIYGGFFSAYLQKNYRMDTYSKLWQMSWRLFISEKFKSIYEKDLRSAWNQFITSIPLPEKLAQPQPFHAQTEKSGFAVSAASPKGFAYYDFNRQAVYFIPVSTGGVAAAPVKLFTADYSLNHLSFSEDGMELIVSDSIAASAQTARKRSRIFNMESRRFAGTPLYSSLAACFTDAQTLCSVMMKNQEFSLVLADRSSGEIKKHLYTAGPGKTFAALYNPCPIGDGKIACIAANGVKRTILFVDTASGELTALPQSDAPYALRYLQSVKSGGRYVLSFAWAEMDMLYRLGLYYPASGELKVQHTDISGGVLFPAVLPATEDALDNTIVYTGQHGTYHRLYTMTEAALTAKTVLPVGLSGLSAQPLLTAQEPEAAGTGAAGFTAVSKLPKLELLNPRPYQPAAWLWRAKIAPTFSTPNDMKKIGGYGLGLKFSMLDPTEKIQLLPSFTIFPKPFFAQGSFIAAFQFRPLSFVLGVSDRLEAKNFSYRKTSLAGAIGSVIPLAYSWESLELSYGISSSWIAPLSDTVKTYYSLPYRYTVLAQEGELKYRNIRSNRIIKTPFFAKDTKGIIFSAAAAHAYCIETKTNAAVLQAQADCYLPVVPIRFTVSGYCGVNAKFNPLNGTYSTITVGVPVTDTNYLPVFEVYDSDAMRQNLNRTQTGKVTGGFSGVCDIMLFSYEVQNGSGISRDFLNRVAFHGGYTAALLSGTGKQKQSDNLLYLDTVYLNCLLTFNGAAEFGIEYAHPMRTPLKKGKMRIISNIKL